MRSKLRITILCLVSLAALAFASAGYTDVTGKPHDLSLDNPKGHCINCHDLHQTELGEGHPHNLKRANEIEVCYQCHAGALNNYSSIDKSMPNVTSLQSRYDILGEFSQAHIHFPRYGMDGEKNKCSYCHNPHGVFDHTTTTRRPKLLSAGQDVLTDTDDYCLVCHNGDANPPHARFPNISVGAQYLLSRTWYRQMTHSTFFRWSTLNEPVPDSALTYDDNPYGAGKDISCLTCHRPHGSPNEHMLRLKDDQDLCLFCHNGSKAGNLTPFTTVGHGKAGIRLICQNCHFPHGTGQRHAVRKSISDPHTLNNMTADVTGKGMNEACFACHGAAGSARYYTGKQDYAAAVHNTSPNARNGNDTPNDYLPGECINCHDPHGRGYAKMAVEPDQALCYDCHNQATPNTLSGRDVSAAFQGMSSAHDLTKVKCMNCHNVHKATQAAYLMNPYSSTATVSDKKVFCLKCHSGRMPSGVTGAPNICPEWTNSGHDKAHVLACDDCHDSHGSPNRKTLNYLPKSSGGRTADFTRGLSFNSRAFCEACHNRSGLGYKGAKTIPTGAGYASQHGQSDTTPCSDCHSRKHNPTLSSYTGASSYYTTYCLNCHTQGAGNPYPDADADFNYPAGQGGQRLYTSVHQITYNPPAAVDCVKCHGRNHETEHSPTNKVTDPDRTDNGGALDNMSSIRTSNRFCLECHDTTPVSFGSKTAPTVNSGALANGGFEEGTLAHWTAADGVLTAARSISLRHLGAASVSLTNWQQTCWDDYEYEDYDCTPTGYFVSDTFAVTPSTAYSYSGYVDVPGPFGWGGTSLVVTEYTSAGAYVTQRASGGVGVTSGWQKISLSWTTAPTTGKVVLGVQLYGPGTAYWDDFESSVATGGHNTGGALLCHDCHDYHKSLNRKLLRYTPRSFGGYTADFAPGKNFNTRGFCESCHDRAGAGFKGSKKIPTGAGYMAQHGQSDTTPCSNCHTDKHNPSITASYYSAACLGQYCHTQGSGNPYPDADGQFNTPGAANDANQMGSAHRVNYSPPATVECTVCHGPNHRADHSPDNKVVDPDPAHPATNSLDIRSSSAFCLQCHDATPVNIGGQAPPNIMDTYTCAGHGKASVSGVICYDCHEYHGSPYKKLLKTSVRGVPVMSTYSGDNAGVCTACHRQKDGRIPKWPGYSAYSASVHSFGNRSTGNLARSGLHGPGACVNCHNPHGARVGGKATHSMAYKDEEDLCFNCHNGATHNTASGDDVQARFQMGSRHGISSSDQLGADGLPGTTDDSKVECSDCHDPHVATAGLVAFGEVSGAAGRQAVPAAAGSDFCLKCHGGSPPSTVKFPEGGNWNKFNYSSSAHGNRRFRYNAYGAYTSVIPCTVCHDPHGSNQNALQRDTWDINRDGMPDDIDGDGVLDSTDMVGFIGYSTGTRKPILVGAVAGIPSRALFRRVSSTIPLQGNGTVDVELCLGCHDGSPAYDVKSDMKKRSHHPVEYSQQVALGGAKIECYNCHDQHRAQAIDEAAGRYPTTNPKGQREPMPGDAAFCLKCHDNNPPAGVSFGSQALKNIKLSYNPTGTTDSRGYDVITSYQGHYVQETGAPLMCRDCHNQHGSEYGMMLRDNTEPGKPGYDPSQPVQGMAPIALRPADPMGGGDGLPLSSPAERCLACHSGGTTYKGGLIPLPPPPDSAERGFPMPPVGRHPDMKDTVTQSDVSPDGLHIYKAAFALVTTPGSVKAQCTECHDSHSPDIKTVDGELMDCYRCHNQNTSLPDAQSEFNDNPTNPACSQSIHPVKYDPTDTASTSVECLKCHDQSRHMGGRVRLRKDPSRFDNYTSDANVWVSRQTTNGRVDSTLSFTNSTTINRFCLECHGPGATTVSSFFRGGVEHVPPRLPAGYASGAHYVNGSLLCTACHEYHGSKNKRLTKNSLPGDGEAFCYNCHDNPAKSMGGVDIKKKFSAMSTASRHTVDAAEQAGNGSRIECGDCHNPHSVTRPAPVVDPADKATAVPADDTFCIGCHGPSGVAGVKFPGYSTGASVPEWGVGTGKWNRWNKGEFESTAHKAGGITCEKCHDPHGSRNVALLLANISTSVNISVRFGMHSTARGGKRMEELGVNGICGSCHNGAMGVFDGFAGFTTHSFARRNGIDKNCTYCHDPHSNEPMMIRSKKPLYMNMTASNFGSIYNFRGFGNSTTGAPYYAFCSSRGCHASERSDVDTFNLDQPPDNYSRDVTSSSHHPIKEGIIGCNSCHKEHGASVNASDNLSPDLRAPYVRQANWYKLHRSGKGLAGGGNGEGGGSGGDGTNYFYNYSPNPINPPGNGSDLCFMCHQKDDIIGTAGSGMAGTNTKFLGHEAVKGGAVMTYQISPVPLSSVPGGEYHNFSCSACHFPHSSYKGKLLQAGCMSQADSPPYPYSPLAMSGDYGSSILWGCHAYRNFSDYGYNRGWRNLTTASKTDFMRPPNAVYDLTASVSDQTVITLNWHAVADAPGQGADHYNVYRWNQSIDQATKPYAARIFKGVAGDAAGAGMAWTDSTGVTANTMYYYALVACDAEGNESLIGNCVAVNLGGDTQPPGAVSDQQVARVDGNTKIRITWHDPGDNSNVVSYKVYRVSGTTHAGPGDINDNNLIGTVADTGPNGASDTTLYSAEDSAALPAQSYSYAVVALDAAGNRSALPTGGTFTINADAMPPAAISVQQVSRIGGTTNVRITWRDPGDDTDGTYVAYYKVYRKQAAACLADPDIASATYLGLVNDTSFGKAGDGTTYTFTDTSAPVTQSYSYAVLAVDAAGNVSPVPAGAGVACTIDADVTPPPAISTQQVGRINGSMSIRVNWYDPGDDSNGTYVSSYKIYRKAGADALMDADIVPGNYLATVNDTSWGKASDGYLYGYTDSTASAGQSYSYAVVAMDAGGNVSHVPAGVTYTVAGDAAPPPAISTQQVSRIDGTTNIRITWRDPGDADTYVSTYKVYRKAGTAALVDADIVTDNYLGSVNDASWGKTADGTTYGYTDTTASAAQSWSYAVVAVDAAGNVSHVPTAAAFTITGDATAPPAISTQQITQPDGSLNVVLTWRDPGDDSSGTCVTTYKVYRIAGTSPLTDTDVIPGNYIGTVNDTSLGKAGDSNTYTYTDTSAQMGAAYAYGVVAIDAAGNVSHAPTGTTLVVTVADPAPNPVTLSPLTVATGWNSGNTGYGNVSLSWTAPANIGAISGYNIYRKAGSALTQTDLAPGNIVASATGLSVQAPIPATGTNYYFSVTAVDQSSSRESKLGNSLATSIPAPPAGFSATLAANSTVNLAWSAPSYVTNFQNYKVYQQYNGGAWTLLATQTATTYSVNLSGQTPGTYGFAVTANYSVYSGAAPYQSAMSAATVNPADTVSPAALPSVTGSLTAASDYNNARITWAAPSDLNYAGYDPSGVDHYVVEANYSGSWQVKNGSYRPAGYNVQGSAITYDDPTALSPGTSAMYRVAAVDASNNSAAAVVSAPVSARPRAISDLNVTSSETTSANVVSFGASISQAGLARYYVFAKEQPSALSNLSGATLIGTITDLAPAENFVHDLQNAALPAEVGHTYAYAVIAEDTGGIDSAVSGGTVTVRAVLDTDSPDKVSDLSLASPAGTTDVVLTWTTPVDNKGRGIGTGAENYAVYRMPASVVGTPVPVTDDNLGSASLVYVGNYASSLAGAFNNYTAAWYDHKAVYYAVRSLDNAGNWSKTSNSPQVIVGKDVMAPTPPIITNCTAAASPEVDVYWTPATDNVEVNGYRLFRADSSTEPFQTDGCINENNIDQAQVAVNLISYDSTSVSDTGGTPGLTYFYALRAWDNETNMSNISNCGIATVRTQDSDATAPTWTGSALSASRQGYPDIDLVWTRADDLNDTGGAGTIDHYDVYRSLSSFTAITESGVTKIATVAGVRDSYVDDTGVPETTYYYGVVAVDASANHNQSALSNVANATVEARPSPDNVNPTVPANLAASTGVYPYMNLSWTASTDVDDASDAQPLYYYKLYRSDYPQEITDANKDNSSVVTTFIMPHDAVGYVARGMGGARYNYRIEAFDLADNASGLSAQVMAQVAQAPCVDTTAPSAPSDLAVLIGLSPDMEISWTASSDSGSCSGQVDHYLLYRAAFQITSGTDLRTLPKIYVSGNTTSYTDSTGAPNTQYWYVMTAVDSSGNESLKSNIVTKTTAADTMAPAYISDLKATAFGTMVQLTWCKPSDNVGVHQYEIYRKEQSTILEDSDLIDANRAAMFYNSGACLSYDDTNVQTGHTYSYAIISVDAAGNRSTISRGRATGDTIAAPQ